MDSNNLTVHLLNKTNWTSWVNASRGQAPAPTFKFAQAILTAFHNRHIGIPPHMVFSLAQMLVDPANQVRAQSPWIEFLARLQREKESSELYNKVSPNELPKFISEGIILRSAPTYTLFCCILPLIEAAQSILRCCYLFSEDTNLPQVELSILQKYEIDFQNQFTLLCIKQDKKSEYLPPFFWQERALTLAALSQKRPILYNPAELSGQESCLPQADPVSLGLLLRQDAFPKHVPPLETIQRRVSPIKHQKSRVKHESGYSGITISHNQDDVDKMLITEYLNPPLILLDRLFNSGFLVIERPPSYEKLRDVLLVGVFLGDILEGITGKLTKACWFQTMFIFSQLLRRQKLPRSEFRWIEADQFGRVRSSTFLLQNLKLPVLNIPLISDLNPINMHYFLKSLRWLPGFTQQSYGFKTIPHQPPPHVSKASSMYWKEWLQKAWSHQTDDPAWSQFGVKALSNRLNIQEFNLVHLMIFCPTKWTADDKSTNNTTSFVEFTASQAEHILQLGQQTGNSVSLISCPDLSLANISDDGLKWIINTQSESLVCRTSNNLSEMIPQIAEAWIGLIIREFKYA